MAPAKALDWRQAEIIGRNIATLRERTRCTRATVIVGSLRDRSPETERSHPSYWMKSKREKALLLVQPRD
ncbi:MAG: hypothetical protein ABF380_13340 [Akkermansiaceae bacterium]